MIGFHWCRRVFTMPHPVARAQSPPSFDPHRKPAFAAMQDIGKESSKQTLAAQCVDIGLSQPPHRSQKSDIRAMWSLQISGVESQRSVAPIEKCGARFQEDVKRKCCARRSSGGTLFQSLSPAPAPNNARTDAVGCGPIDTTFSICGR